MAWRLLFTANWTKRVQRPGNPFSRMREPSKPRFERQYRLRPGVGQAYHFPGLVLYGPAMHARASAVSEGRHTIPTGGA